MKRLTFIAAIVAWALTLSVGAAHAEVYTYTPSPPDCWDLDHERFYTWGINVSDMVGATIMEMELTIENISNGDSDANVLFLNLLDWCPLGTHRINDNGNQFQNAFANYGVPIDAFTDTNGPGTTEDLHYRFSDLGLLDAANAFSDDGVIGIGLDPDCHFYNAGITLTIEFGYPAGGENRTWGQVKNRFKDEGDEEE